MPVSMMRDRCLQIALINGWRLVLGRCCGIFNDRLGWRHVIFVEIIAVCADFRRRVPWFRLDEVAEFRDTN